MVLACATCLTALATALASEPILAGPALERSLDHYMGIFLREQGKRGRGGATAASVAIGMNGVRLLAKGYGEARPGEAAAADTRYPIASITKQFTAAAILSAIDERSIADRKGKPLELTTDIRDVFDGIDHWMRDGGKPIRLQNLLTMTSNLPNFTRMPPALVDPWGGVDPIRLLREMKTYRPQGWPNTFEYNNTGYFLIAQILDPGEPDYRGRLRALFARAGMPSTNFVGDIALGNVATPNPRRKAAFTEAAWLEGSADLVSTVVDLLAWNTALMEGRVLSPRSREIMFSDWARVSPLIYYGMGWYIEHRKGYDLFTHTGSFPGYTSLNLIARSTISSDWQSVSMLANGEEVEDLDVLAEDILRLLRGS